MGHNYSSLQLTLTFKTHTKHAKCMKCINYLSLLWFSPQFQLGGGGESTMRHTYSSLQLTLTSKRTQNTQKCMKCINYLSLLRSYLLLPNCEGSQSALFINSNTKFPIRIHPWKPHLARTCSGEGGERVFQDGRPPFGVVWKTLELGHNSGYVSRVTPPHKHNRHICKCYVTYLLIEWWNFIIRTNLTFATGTPPWWPNMLFSDSTTTTPSNGNISRYTSAFYSLLLRFPLWRDRGSGANAP